MADQMIRVDLTKVKAEILASLPAASSRAQILQGLIKAAELKWMNLAKRNLHSSRRAYLDGIHREGENSLVLDGVVPNMVEQGWAGGDMRQWLLNGPNAKQGAKGKYNVVPFRHGAPGSDGGNVGDTMPQAIHQVAAKLTATISRPGQRVGQSGGMVTVWGERLRPTDSMSDAARKILKTKKKPHHTTSIYMGMVRKAQPTRKGKMQTSGYETFRTISEHTNEPGVHWVHPGIHGRDFAMRVQQYIQEQAAAVITSATGQAK